MEKENRKLFCLGVIQLLIFTVFTVAVKLYGFDSLNGRFFAVTGYNPLLKTVSDVMGLFSLFLVFFFAVCGLVQLINGKSLKAVDRKLIVLGFMYVFMLFCYVLFDKLAINLRPDGTKASYPSSHTLLFLCVNVTAIYELRTFFKNKKSFDIVKLSLVIITVAGIIFRLVCGCHWLTDIFGSILLASSIISFFFAFV